MATNEMPSLKMYFTLEIPVEDVPLVSRCLQERCGPENDYCRVLSYFARLKDQIAAAAKQLEEPSDG